MIAGHTHFPPDSCFGLIYQEEVCRTDVSSLNDLVHVIKESAARNICQLVRAQNGSTIVPSLDWAKFLSHCLDDIKPYHHFCFEQDHSGVVLLNRLPWWRSNSGVCCVGSGHYLWWTNILLYSLLVCLLKDATTGTRRSESTVGMEYEIWYSPVNHLRLFGRPKCSVYSPDERSPNALQKRRSEKQPHVTFNPKA